MAAVFERLTDSIEQRDKDWTIEVWLQDDENRSLAQGIAGHILDLNDRGRDSDVRTYTKKAIGHFDRNLAMAVMIHVESLLLDRKFDSSDREASPIRPFGGTTAGMGIPAYRGILKTREAMIRKLSEAGIK